MRSAYISIACLTIAVVLGMFFRFNYLDQKFFYGDEVVSSLRESGHTERDFAAAFDGHVRSAKDILGFISDRSTSPGDTVRSLSAEDPQHPPLYYLATRYWTSALGDTITNRRSLAAVFGVIAIPAVFWLAYEIFGSLKVAGIASGLVAVSPFQVIYSQQNREYSAWLFFLALVAALLVRNLRRPGPLGWIAYSLLLTAALYTDAFVLVDLLSFALYVGLRERRMTASARNFALSTIVALIAYAPWLRVMYVGAGTITGWQGPLRVAVSAPIYILKWGFNTASVFFDVEYEHSWLMPVAIIVLLGVAASFGALFRQPTARGRLFIVTLTFVPVVAFVASDVLAHTSRATASRYLIPVWLGCELAVAYVIGKLLFNSPAPRVRLFGSLSLVGLIMCGVASNVVNLPARQTSATAEMGRLARESRAIDASRNPLVVYVHDGEHWDIAAIMLAVTLKPDARVQLFARARDVRLDDARRGFFLYEASTQTRLAVEHANGGRWEPIDDGTFGSGFVNELRQRAISDRSRKSVRTTYGVDLWRRLPDRVDVGRAASVRAPRGSDARGV